LDSKDGEWGEGGEAVGLREATIIRGTDFSELDNPRAEFPRRWIKDHLAERKRLQPGDIILETAGGTSTQSTGRSALLKESFFRRHPDIPDVQVGEFEVCPFRFHKTSNLKSRKLRPNDFVFEVSGGSKDQFLGRNVLVTDRVLKFFGAPVIAASFCKQIRFCRELVSPYFMKYFLKLYYDHDLVSIYQVQSTGISNYQFESFLKFQTILLPPTALQKQFEDKVKSIIEMHDDIALVNIALRKMRDRLISADRRCLTSGRVFKRLRIGSRNSFCCLSLLTPAEFLPLWREWVMDGKA
jgi:hypothetical protein